MSQQLVETVKAQLIAQGADLSGPCGALKIVQRVAWVLSGSGAGLLHKRPEQNGCNVGSERYAVDIVMYPDGRAIDILADAGGANGPLWNAIEPIDPSLWRPAIDPGDTPMPGPDPIPDPEPEPPAPIPPPVDLGPLLARLDALEYLTQQHSLRIEEVAETPYYIEGQTARSWGHGHDVRLSVKKGPR